MTVHAQDIALCHLGFDPLQRATLRYKLPDAGIAFFNFAVVIFQLLFCAALGALKIFSELAPPRPTFSSATPRFFPGIGVVFFNETWLANCAIANVIAHVFAKLWPLHWIAPTLSIVFAHPLSKMLALFRRHLLFPFPHIGRMGLFCSMMAHGAEFTRSVVVKPIVPAV